MKEFRKIHREEKTGLTKKQVVSYRKAVVMRQEHIGEVKKHKESSAEWVMWPARST